MFIEHKEQGEQQVKELDEASKLLLSAAALLETGGHCQSGCYGEGGSRCTIAAIGESTASGTTTEAALDRLREALGTKGDPRGIIRWNDSTPTALVIAKLRAVALGIV